VFLLSTVFFLIGLLSGGGVAAVHLRYRTALELAEKKKLDHPKASRASPEVSPQKKARVKALIEKGFRLKKQERWSEAFDAFSECVKLVPDEPWPYFYLAEVYEALDYREKAAELYRKALRLDPGWREPKVRLAKILCDFGRNREALKLLEKAYRSNPKDPLVWGELALNHLRLGETEKALPLIKRYVQTVPDDPWGWEHLGRVYAQQGDQAEAEKAYRRALALNPHRELAQLWLGQLLISQGKKKEAQKHLKAFHRIRDLNTREYNLLQAVSRYAYDPQRLVAILVELARVRASLGRYRQALVPLDRALRLAPEDPRLKVLYEKIRSRAGM